MRQRSRNSCRPFGTSDAPSSRTTGSRPWLHLIVPPGLNHSPRNHLDGVPPMVSLIKILNGVALGGFGHSFRIFPGRCPGLSHCVPLALKHVNKTRINQKPSRTPLLRSPERVQRATRAPAHHMCLRPSADHPSELSRHVNQARANSQLSCAVEPGIPSTRLASATDSPAKSRSLTISAA